MADHVAGGGAHRIDAPVFLDEAEARLTKLVDLGLLHRSKLALDGDVSLSLLQLLAQLSRVDVGQNARHLLDQLVTIDDLRRIGVEGGALDIGGKQPAVAIEDVGPVHRGGNVMKSAGAWHDGGKAEGDKPHRNGEEAQRKGKAGKPIAIAALRQRGAFGRG